MIFKHGAHLAWRAIDDEAVIIDIRGKRVLWLSQKASKIWKALDSEGSVADLPKGLDSDPLIDNTAGHERILHELCDAGILVCEPDPNQSVVPFPVQAPPTGHDEPAILWIEPLEQFAGLCGKTPTDIGIPDCMASPNQS